MAKGIKAIDVIDIVVPVGENRTEKAMETFVLNGLQHYKNGKAYVHVVAVQAVLWAAETGSASLVNMVYSGLGGSDKESTDQGKLRVWLGKASAFKATEKGVEVDRSWIGFRAKDDGNKKRGFFTKKGETFDLARKVVSAEQLRDGERFYDAANKTVGDYDLLKLLEMLQAIEKKTETKAEKNAFEVPSDVLEAVKSLALVAKQAVSVAKH